LDCLESSPPTDDNVEDEDLEDADVADEVAASFITAARLRAVWLSSSPSRNSRHWGQTAT